MNELNANAWNRSIMSKNCSILEIGNNEKTTKADTILCWKWLRVRGREREIQIHLHTSFILKMHAIYIVRNSKAILLRTIKISCTCFFLLLLLHSTLYFLACNISSLFLYITNLIFHSYFFVLLQCFSSIIFFQLICQ